MDSGGYYFFYKHSKLSLTFDSSSKLKKYFVLVQNFSVRTDFGPGLGKKPDPALGRAGPGSTRKISARFQRTPTSPDRHFLVLSLKLKLINLSMVNLNPQGLAILRWGGGNLNLNPH